ncbi:hypothetical protein TRIP_B40317 [uncultured Desulfatiglans sp.]|nr:hypothetical protein TRIP_B40317 [uncultured Desulfatiglans sp.]
MCDISQWQVRSLNCLSEIGSGSAPLSQKGSFPIMGANGQIGSTDRSNFELGYLVGRVGSVGAIKYISSPCWASDNTLTVKPKPAVCDLAFLGHLLFFFHPEKLATINAQPLITQTNLGNLSTVVPRSTDEQHAIATILDTVDEAIRRTEALIAKLRQVKVGMLHDLLTCGLNENGELRDPIRHPEQFKNSPLGRIPKGWEINTIGSLIKELEAGASVNAWDRPAGGGDFGVLKTSCVFGGKFLPEENKTVLPRDQARVSCPVRANSIIISRMNTPLLVGESGYVKEEHPGIYLPDRLWQAVMREEKRVSVKWLSHVLNWEPVRKFIRDIATGTSGSMKNISKGVFLSIEIKIPLPDEQESIANRLGAFDAIMAKESKKSSKLHQLKQGLMHDLLTGRVRMPESILQKYQAEVAAE